jgi:hypothetical protein
LRRGAVRLFDGADAGAGSLVLPGSSAGESVCLGTRASAPIACSNVRGCSEMLVSSCLRLLFGMAPFHSVVARMLILSVHL